MELLNRIKEISVGLLLFGLLFCVFIILLIAVMLRMDGVIDTFLADKEFLTG